jgi:hypothetical protein
MKRMRKLSWLAPLAAVVLLGGCGSDTANGDGGEDNNAATIESVYCGVET